MFQNKLGTTSEILVLYISKYRRRCCEQSHDGNFGPKFLDLNPNYCTVEKEGSNCELLLK